MATASSNVLTGTFLISISICESIHRECLALVSSLIESGDRTRHQELVTLSLAVAQLAHTQMTLAKLKSAFAIDMAPPFARTCSTARQAFEKDPQVTARESLISALMLAETSFHD